ncbi:hypothetical protein [Streptomyces sp. ok210]|uniref:hypothetical protein n=1 Tax=Streptomyces sp. ok210 TaxID=1761905 RepID=UPI0015A665C3|nr:hypothetical protein [Streptomyces sp. ok210]
MTMRRGGSLPIELNHPDPFGVTVVLMEENGYSVTLASPKRSPAEPVARDFDDDAHRRVRDADELINARKREADERIYVVTTNLVVDAQEKLARRRRLDRIWRAGRSRSGPAARRSRRSRTTSPHRLGTPPLRATVPLRGSR